MDGETLIKVDSPPKKGGRPTKYQEKFAEMAYNYALLGATDEQLAIFFLASEASIKVWKSKHPEFGEALHRGKAVADAQISHSLYKSAMGLHYIEEEKAIPDGQGGFQIITLKRQIAPNTTSQIFWLKNRQSTNWRDKVEIDAVVKGDPFPAKEVLDKMYAESLARSEEQAKKLIGRRERLGIVTNTNPDNE